MGKRVKSVSMPGLAAKLHEIDRQPRWSVRRTVNYTRTTMSNTVDIEIQRGPFGDGWDGLVASAEMDDDGLLSSYKVRSDVPYKIGRILDTAWESLP